ncbi:penicillin-binding protein activator [Imhoffiella purpurea]|uniref:LppC putative lipoprotein n=1 Tax=Imhoffiella purpurea TaxID=1249627 RepID=W9VYL1_9GAMM|nr:penicillin-binding protein activator [Imhoffiella purpurea]EXJ15480.1 LppC putative lipoprotein [Imhoffiella purpurea]
MPENRVARPHLSSVWWLMALVAAALLSACALNPTFDESRILAGVAESELEQTAAIEAKGKKIEAAERYLQLASRAQPPARAQLQLKALHAYVSGGRTDEARGLIDTLSAGPLMPIQRQLMLLEQADLAMLTSHPSESIALLERMRSSALPRDLAARRLRTLASAQRLADQPVQAAESLAELDRILESKDKRLENQIFLVSTLTMLTQPQLQNLSSRGSPVKGWAEIALAFKTHGSSPERIESGYRAWRGKHAGHPALPGLGEAYAETLSGGYAEGDRVSVMLPRSGRFAAAARAVRKGIEAARRADTGGHAPKLDFEDSSNVSGAQAMHARAVRSGADYVIGPLQKPAVNTLLGTRHLSIPTLALNQATRSNRRAENLFQFALSPENEASEAATASFTAGAKRALILYPAGAWGNRMASAFRRQWRNLGGTLAGQATYDPSKTNHDAILTRLLTDSDPDVLFLVATAESARHLYPRIQQTASKPLRVISTSHVYSGAFDPSRDKPLIGLYFVDIPWMLDTEANGPLSRRTLMGASANAADPLARLYAMGIDAYRLAPRLTDLSKNPAAYYPGQTGGLSLDKLGRIKRQLALGQFTPEGPRFADTSGGQ